jgi:hypothetical protein
MGELYLTETERAALSAISDGDLDRLIDQAISDETPGDLQRLRLSDCGPYVASQFHSFTRALAAHREAKSSLKRDQTETTLRRVSFDLRNAVRLTTERMEIERKEEQYFRVDEWISAPYRFSSRLTVRVAFQWRRTVDDQWEFGNITFVHDVEPRPTFAAASPKRKSSASNRAREQENEWAETWDHLATRALHSVREFLRNGGDPTKIPNTYQATVDSHSRLLNNYSTQFWRDQKQGTT